MSVQLPAQLQALVDKFAAEFKEKGDNPFQKSPKTKKTIVRAPSDVQLRATAGPSDSESSKRRKVKINSPAASELPPPPMDWAKPKLKAVSPPKFPQPSKPKAAPKTAAALKPALAPVAPEVVEPAGPPEEITTLLSSSITVPHLGTEELEVSETTRAASPSKRRKVPPRPVRQPAKPEEKTIAALEPETGPTEVLRPKTRTRKRLSDPASPKKKAAVSEPNPNPNS